MNSAGHSRTTAPRYDNRRREQQALENRGRILEAAVELLAARKGEMTVPEVALRAGVSVPTVYRNFPTREALFEAVAQEIVHRLGAPPPAHDVDAFVEAVPALHAYFAANAATIRAALQVGPLNEILAKHGRRARDRSMAALFREVTGHLAAEEAKAVFALIRTLTGSEVALSLFDRYGLSPGDTGSVVRWATKHLVAALRAGRARGERSLSSFPTMGGTTRRQR